MPDSETAVPSGPSEFGRWLFATRNAKNISVPDLADKSGVSIPQIYNIESGRSQNPQDKTRLKLTNALGEEPTHQIVTNTENAATIESVGEFIDFDPHDETDLPVVAGVYALYDISERPVYVGQSMNIRDRIMHDHVSRFWFRAPVVQNAAYLKIEDETLRKKIEKIMIRFLKSNAVINKQYVDRER